MFRLGGNTFAPNTDEENRQALADMLPQGLAFNAKNIEGSNIYKLLSAIAKGFTRKQEKINEISVEYNPETTTNLINEWEAAVGIPDDCFSNTVSLELRRKQVVAKLAKMNVQTAQDFIDLAAYFGYAVEIRNGARGAEVPLILPFPLGDLDELINTMVVKFVDLDQPNNSFPVTLPFTLGDAGNIIICIFKKLRPAMVEIQFEYKDS